MTPCVWLCACACRTSSALLLTSVFPHDCTVGVDRGRYEEGRQGKLTVHGITRCGTNVVIRMKAFGNAWRGAAAYHYFMLAQRQFYNGMTNSLPMIQSSSLS